MGAERDEKNTLTLILSLNMQKALSEALPSGGTYLLEKRQQVAFILSLTNELHHAVIPKLIDSLIFIIKLR